MKKGISIWSFPTAPLVKNFALAKDAGGNISDLGGYYNELLYFTDRAKAGEKVTEAALKDGVESLEFLIEELSFKA